MPHGLQAINSAAPVVDLQISGMAREQRNADVVLIGCGIMSGTLGVLLKELSPKLSVHVFERLDEIAGESSDAWNNAGTGHAGLCELNYTPERPDGSIDLSKAIRVDEEFEQSKQFWSWLAAQGRIDPQAFIHSLPHMSFVEGAANREFLRKRHAAMDAHPLFHGMEFGADRSVIAQWAPLLMKDRHDDGTWSATRSMLGTDVNYGALTRLLFADLSGKQGVVLHMGHEVRDLHRMDNGRWRVEVKELKSGVETVFQTGFVFIGAGGGALPLLEKSDIPEAKGYGGFPVSGEWLRCLNPAIIKQHHAKVYGKAKSGSPPMSVPHLDRRTIGRDQALLFGPFAGFSTKFLKHGSWLDLPSSLEWGNLIPMVEAGWKNLDLTKYLIEQVRLRRTVGTAEGVHAQCRNEGLGARHCRPTGAGDQEGPQGRRYSGVRYRAGGLCGWELGRTAGRLSRCQHVGIHHAGLAGALFQGTNGQQGMENRPRAHGGHPWQATRRGPRPDP